MRPGGGRGADFFVGTRGLAGPRRGSQGLGGRRGPCWGRAARGSLGCAPRGTLTRAVAPGPVRRPRDPAGSGPGGRGAPARTGLGRAGRSGVTSRWELRPRESGVPGQRRAGRGPGPAPGRQGTREEGAGAGRKAASPSAAGTRGRQDAGVTFGDLVAGGAEEGRRGSETPVRPEAAEAPASWGARFPSARFPFSGSRSSNPRREPECGPSRALLWELPTGGRAGASAEWRRRV